MQDQPSQAEQLVPQIPKRDELLSQIDTLITNGSPEKDLTDFIRERLSSLNTNSVKRQISINTDLYAGFIHSLSEIKPSLMVDGFNLDDEELYLYFFRSLQEFKKAPGWRDKPIRDIIPFAIQRTIATYFGNPYGDNTTETANKIFYMDHTYLNSDPVSVKAFKGKNIAVCIEKASVAQNLSSFLMFDSILVISPKCKLNPGAKEETHAYNILKH